MCIDNEIAYSECIQKVPKFSYNIIHKVFFGLSLNIKYLCIFANMLSWKTGERI